MVVTNVPQVLFHVFLSQLIFGEHQTCQVDQPKKLKLKSEKQTRILFFNEEALEGATKNAGQPLAKTDANKR